MLNYSYIPKFKDFLLVFKIFNKNNEDIIKKIWCKGNKDYLKLFTRSNWIIYFFCFLRLKDKDKIIIWLPSYYCSETIYLINKLNVEICYYNLNLDLSPDENSLLKLSKLSNPHIILFCHFFGKYSFSQCLKDLAIKHNAWLIEDCTHCISPSENIAKNGDIVIFSPYKFFPMPHGAIMTTSTVFLEKNNLTFFFEDLNLKFNLNQSLKLINFSKKNNWYFILKWFVKRIFAKINLNFISIQNFYFDEKIKTVNFFNHPTLEYFSKNILIKYARNIETEKEKRKRIAILWENYLIQYSIFSNKNFILNNISSEETPYFFLISDTPNNIIDKYEFLKKKRIPILTWPSLAQSVSKNNDYKNANFLRNTIIFLPLHDQQKNILKKIKLKKKIFSEIFSYEQIDDDEWSLFFNRIKNTNILQSLNYGKAQMFFYKVSVERFLIRGEDQKEIALLQVLKKKIFFLTFYRINRGPILFDEVSEEVSKSVVISIINKFKKKFCYLKITPELNFSSSNILLSAEKYNIYFKQPSWTSSIIDLQKDENLLMSQLKPNWRNQLKLSSKKNLCVKNENSNESIINIINLSTIYAKLHNYKSINLKFLKFFLQNSECKIFNAYNNNILISSICISIHGCSSTYLLGWSNYEGRKLNAMNLLIWKAILDLKKNEIQYFDLGGFDNDKSTGVTNFKIGIGGSNYKLVGNFFI